MLYFDPFHLAGFSHVSTQYIHTVSLRSSTPGPQLECESYESQRRTRNQAHRLSFFCSAALTGKGSLPHPTSPPCSPPVHPHKSLMVCRLHRAALWNDIITISKEPAAAASWTYRPELWHVGWSGTLSATNCIITTLHLNDSQRVYVALSPSKPVVSIRDKALMRCVCVSVCCWRVSCDACVSNKSPVSAAVSFKADREERDWITGRMKRMKRRNTLEVTIYLLGVVHMRGVEGGGGLSAPPQQLEVLSFKYRQSPNTHRLKRFLLQH